MPLLFGLVAALGCYYLGTEMVTAGHSAFLQWAFYLMAIASLLYGVWGAVKDIYDIRDTE